MIKVGLKALTDAHQKGLPILFRAESIREDLFVCRAEWIEGGVAHYALTKRFRASSDQQADFMANETMRADLAALR